jgi:ferritin-like metal-binding protein YciE
MVEKTLSDLFLAQLKDIFYAEKKIFGPSPRWRRRPRCRNLRKPFTAHREETLGQIERLEQVFEMIGKRPQAKPCRGDDQNEDAGDEGSDGLQAMLRSFHAADRT